MAAHLPNSHTCVSGTTIPSSSAQHPSNACVTKLHPLHLSQRWKVENFASVVKLSRPGTCLRSQVFRHSGFQDACWQLCLYPGGKREENANNVSLFLKMSATTPTKEVLLKAEYRFYFMDDAEGPKFSNVNIGDFHAKPPKGGHSWGLRNIPRQKVLNSLREDGSLMILCEIELIPDVNKVRCQNDKLSAVAAGDLVQVPRAFISAQRALLNEGTLSDCEVAVGPQGRVFASHKCMLAAQSPVFAAMFGHEEVLEAKQSRVEIADFSVDAVSAMLTYIYTGSTENVELADLAEELLGLSEKYQLDHLKDSCQDYLLSRIDKSNVCQTLAVADLYQAHTLQQACICFVNGRKQEVLNSESWTQLKKRNPRLVSEILEQVVRAADAPAVAPPCKRFRSS